MRDFSARALCCTKCDGWLHKSCVGMLTAEYEVLKQIFHLHGTALFVVHQIVRLYFMMPKILATLIQWVVKTALEVYIQMSA